MALGAMKIGDGFLVVVFGHILSYFLTVPAIRLGLKDEISLTVVESQGEPCYRGSGTPDIDTGSSLWSNACGLAFDLKVAAPALDHDPLMCRGYSPHCQIKTRLPS